MDLTVIGLGRYIPRIQRVAALTPLQIVVATGIYTYNDLPFHFHFRGPGTDIGRSGAHGRDVRAGHRRGHRGHRRDARPCSSAPPINPA